MNASDAAMPMVELGNTGKRISRFGLGGFHQVEISSEIVAEVVDTYLACGGNYIETARGYGAGASEHKIGRALEGRRDQVILASKSGKSTADEFRADLEESLRLLRTDRIDFYFFHGLTSGGIGRVAGPGGALEGLLAAKEEGLIDGIGMSSHVPQSYLDAFERLPIDLILIWCNYLDNLNFPIIPERVIPEARRRGVGVTAMKPLADGYLYRSVEDAVRYTLACDAEVVICGANAVEHVRQVAAAVASGPADAAECERILRDAPELGNYVCRRCGKCPAELMDAFRLEGVYDRQMVDYLPHDPADYALRQRLAKWFSGDKAAVAEFTYDPAALIAAAEGVDCPYDIDVPRKARLACAKLTDQKPQVI